MLISNEPVSSSRLLECLVQHPLEPRGGPEVPYRAAGDADEVMVVGREILRKLEAGARVGHGHDPTHRASLLEHLKTAVERALGEPRLCVDDLGNGQRPVGRREGVDELLAAAGVALAGAAKSLRHLAVYVSGHLIPAVDLCPFLDRA